MPCTFVFQMLIITVCETIFAIPYFLSDLWVSARCESQFLSFMSISQSVYYYCGIV